MRLGLLPAKRVPVTAVARRRVRGQSATEYIVFLGTISALVVFASPFLIDMRRTTNETFTCAARRILSDGRWRTDSSLPQPCQ